MNLLIEPHHDDILLSCEHLLRQEGYLLTCNQIDRRTSENIKKYYPKIVPIILPIHEVGFNEANTFDIDNMNVDGPNNPFYEYRFIFNDLIEQCDNVYLPAGIYHPHHLLVSKYFSKLLSNKKLFDNIKYYVDMPYFNEWKSLILDNKLFNKHYEAIEHYVTSGKCSRVETYDKVSNMKKIYGEFYLTGKEQDITCSIVLDKRCKLW